MSMSVTCRVVYGRGEAENWRTQETLTVISVEDGKGLAGKKGETCI